MKNSAPNDSERGPVFAALHVLHDREPKSAALNMAIDEVLLQTATRPLLRFYGWRRPALSFGYFGRYSEVAADASRRELVRRWTGGGIVLHGEDLTYSVILPRSELAASSSPQSTYRAIHGAIQAALSPDFEIALADRNAPKISDACFANAVTADVLLAGRKIAGAAQRRTRAGLLHQGSIQYGGLPASFPEAFAKALCASCEPIALDPDLLGRAELLATARYATSEWLQQR